MRRAVLLLTVAALSGCASAPGAPSPADREAVLAVVDDFFRFIETHDAELGERVLVPDGAFVTVRARDGQRSIGAFTNASSIERMRGATQEMREVFTEEPTVLVDGDVAVVWGRYAFEVDGAPSHTGVDAFNLVRTENGWKISGGAYSVVR